MVDYSIHVDSTKILTPDHNLICDNSSIHFIEEYQNLVEIVWEGGEKKY